MEMKKSELARMTGVGNSTLTKMTRGENVNMDILVRVCAALKCDLFDIVELLPDEGGKDNKTPSEE
jgi:DNA-binding Xre family transcriptional regulator